MSSRARSLASATLLRRKATPRWITSAKSRTVTASGRHSTRRPASANPEAKPGHERRPAHRGHSAGGDLIVTDVARSARRETRSGFAPAEPIRPPPVFVWPPQPMPFVKWFFGYPGYLWPWNSLYAAIAILTWFLLTPDLADMKTFEIGWIATIFGRNLGLIILVAGAWHLRLYVQ